MLFDHTLMNHQKIFSMKTAKKICVVKVLKKAMKYLTYVRYNMNNGNLFFGHTCIFTLFFLIILHRTGQFPTPIFCQEKQTAKIFQLIIKTDIINVNYSIFLQEGTKSTQITTS